MTNGIYVALSGSVAVEKNMNNVSNNLANASTTGFKKEKTVFSEYVHQYRNGEIDEMMDKYAVLQDKSFVDVDDTYTDFMQGSLKESGNPMDFALSGDAFFKVQKGDEALLQRGGQFTIDSNGQLTTHDGALVLGEENQPITLNPEQKMHVNEAGEIYQEGIPVGRLQLVTCDNKAWLEKAGDTRFRIGGQGQEIDAENAVVMQGFLEKSNVNVVAEMVEMIKIQKHYDASSQAVKTYQKMDETANNKVGRV